MKLIQWFRFEDEVITIKASALMWGVATIMFSTIAVVNGSIYFYPQVNLPVDVIDIAFPFIMAGLCYLMVRYIQKEKHE